MPTYYDSITCNSGPVFRRVVSSGPKVTRLEMEIGPGEWRPSKAEKTPQLRASPALVAISEEEHREYTRRTAELWETILGRYPEVSTAAKRWSTMADMRQGVLRHCFGDRPSAL